MFAGIYKISHETQFQIHVCLWGGIESRTTLKVFSYDFLIYNFSCDDGGDKTYAGTPEPSRMMSHSYN